MNLKRFFIIATLAAALAIPFFAQAQIIDPSTIEEASSCGQPGKPACSLNVFVKVGVNVANFILGIVGALTLLMFVFGGLTWMLSGGSSSAVQKGKDIIIGSVVGLMIVFASYLIINFVVNNVFEAKNANNKPLFSGTTSNNQITPVNNPAGTECKKKPGPGYCIADTGICNESNNEASTPSDCGKGKVCCYVSGQQGE